MAVNKSIKRRFFLAGLQIVVAAALLDPSGRVLVQRRPNGKAHAGLWEFPGGKVEGTETLEHGLCRELQEELGIRVSPSCLSPICYSAATSGETVTILLLFGCSTWIGEPKPHHATELRWLDVGQLQTLDMPPLDRPFIPALEALSRA